MEWNKRMKYENLKRLCEEFNKIVNKCYNRTKEEYDFINVWKLELAKVLMLDFGEDTMFDVACAIIDLYEV